MAETTTGRGHKTRPTRPFFWVAAVLAAVVAVAGVTVATDGGWSTVLTLGNDSPHPEPVEAMPPPSTPSLLRAEASLPPSLSVSTPTDPSQPTTSTSASSSTSTSTPASTGSDQPAAEPSAPNRTPGPSATTAAGKASAGSPGSPAATRPPVRARPAGQMLRRQGTRLVNSDGQPVTLRGINLGGWLMWEAWIWGGINTMSPTNSETHMLEWLTGAVGPEATERFRQQIYDTYITEDDIARIADLGYNSVRVPINHRAIEDPARPGSLDPKGIRRIDRLLEWAAAHKIWVVLDLPAAPGGQSTAFIADPDEVDLWSSAANQDRTVKLWGELAARYADNPWIAGYDVLNEPMVFPAERLVDFYRRVITAIRKADRNHAIILEGNFWAHQLQDLGPELLDDNVMYSLHAYGFTGHDLEADLAEDVAYAQSLDVPLYVGEFGMDTRLEVQRWTDTYRSTPEVAGWASWTWKRTQVPDVPAVQQIEPPPSWQAVIIAITLDQPLSGFDVQAGMDDFVASLGIGQTVEDRLLARSSS